MGPPIPFTYIPLTGNECGRKPIAMNVISGLSWRWKLVDKMNNRFLKLVDEKSDMFWRLVVKKNYILWKNWCTNRNCGRRLKWFGDVAAITDYYFHQANPHVHQQHVVLATTFRSRLPQPLSSHLIKAGATRTETPLPKQHAAGERVDLLDDYDFPARAITENRLLFFVSLSILFHKQFMVT